MKSIELLQECKLQFEYLNEKFGKTGTTNAMIGKIGKALNLACASDSVAFADWIGEKQANGSWFRYHGTKLWFLYLHGHLTTEKLYDIYLKEETIAKFKKEQEYLVYNTKVRIVLMILNMSYILF